MVLEPVEHLQGLTQGRLSPFNLVEHQMQLADIPLPLRRISGLARRECGVPSLPYASNASWRRLAFLEAWPSAA